MSVVGKLSRSLLLAALALPLWNCAYKHDADERYFLVATNIKIPYWQAAEAGLYQAALELGVKAEFVGSETYDPKAQQEDFRRVVARNPSGILVSVADPELLGPGIDSAIARGIPVITIDSDAPNSKRLLYIGTDNYRVGLMGGRIAAKHLQGKGNVVVFTMPEQANLNERLRGYQDAFAEHPQIRITEVVDIHGDATIAFDRTTEILEKRRDAVQAFVCLEALACKEVAEVANRQNVRDKVIVAMDTDDLTLEWIEKGSIISTVAQKPFTMAFAGVKMLDDLYHHKPANLDRNWARDLFSPIPVFVDTGASLIDKSNVAEFKQSLEAATTPR